MFALIKKTLANKEWLMGFCGTPAEIAEQFLSSGVKDLYQQAWFSIWSADLEDSKEAIDALDEAAQKNTADRKTIETINFAIVNWMFSCVGVAEDNYEAKKLAEKLARVNCDMDGVPQFRQDRFGTVLTMLEAYPEVDELEFQKALRAAENLNLKRKI